MKTLQPSEIVHVEIQSTAEKPQADTSHHVASLDSLNGGLSGGTGVGLMYLPPVAPSFTPEQQDILTLVNYILERGDKK